MSSCNPKIAIVGAGPAGLTLGVLLHNRGVPFNIFELRQLPMIEELAKPSGSLDLHEDSGLAAIKECGLFDQFLPLTAECSEDDRIADKDGNILYADEGEHSNRPEISRHALTKLLLSSLPVDVVRWEHKLVSVTSSTTSGHTGTELNFGPRGKHIFDLVVGADGAWSRVRELLTDVKPHYAGIQNITATVRHITEKHSHLAELIGRGTFAALGIRHGVCSQRGAEDSARIYVFVTTSDEDFATSAGLAGKTAANAKDVLLANDTLLGKWGTKLKELVRVVFDAETADNPGASVDVKPLYTLPVGISWDHKAGVTVIGDAAHLMCPWAGEGVNVAMCDSLLLSRAIVKAYEAAGRDAASFQRTLEPLLGEFEVNMMARAKEKAEETFRNGQIMFGECGAAGMVELFRSHGQLEQ
ncbi:uncharacterized protein A1O5_10323 [Cladophialophora psammophila CBS 110553]|uniref:FAD-binding domain-containing protein n=1 Tax=Cladophialophora psammophila CBS 110553 TaxID=1182543 RepID=W9WEV8_9EURO|nr:uncharacterized protein A1O5_10323 [Cladophialophora psammophila CBS 110553]EXJ66652.1 hypothetical protein A1O5_10323 [Cladophialophora psammophila CBS 110553]